MIDKYIPVNTSNSELRNSISNNQSIINALNESMSITYEGSSKEHFIDSIIKERKISKLQEKAMIDGAELYFNNKLFKIFCESLVIDTEFIDQNKNALKKYFGTKLSEDCNYDIYKVMNEVKNNSEYLANLVNEAKCYGKKKSKEVAEKCNEGNSEDEIDNIFDDIMNDQEDEELDLDSEEACNIIKDKVVEVIASEEKANEEKKKIMEEIQAAKDENNLTEASLMIPDKLDETFSLFNAITMHNYKSVLKGITENGNMGEYANLSESGEVSVNMDMIMCESIIDYTRLELFNTLRLKNFSKNDIYEMSNNLAHM